MLVRVKSAFLWAVCCFSSFSFAAWDGTAEVPSARDTVIFYDYEDFHYEASLPLYHISTPEQLAGLAQLVNTVEPAENPEKATENIPWRGVVVLDNDLVFGKDENSVSEHPWIPIGKNEKRIGEMIFDGKNHTIYGLDLTTQSDSIFGLFGFVEHTELKNVTLANYKVSMKADSTYRAGDFYGGSLVGYAKYSNIHNVHTRGGAIKIEVLQKTMIKDEEKGDYYVGVDEVSIGGIVGLLKGWIDSSSNASDVDVTFFENQNVGGIAGEILRQTEGSYDSVTYCSNSGNITSKSPELYNDARVGGIAGLSNAPVAYSQNTGAVSGDVGMMGGIVGTGGGYGDIAYCENSGDISTKKLYAGGIAGYGSKVRNSVNKGRVEGIFAGGIIGNAGPVTLCINEGFVKGQVVGGISGMTDRGLSQVVNRGTLEGDTVGGICGRNLGAISSSYSYASKVTAKDVVGGVVGYNQGTIITSAFDSTLQPSVKLVGVEGEGNRVKESFALSTKEMQSVEFADKLNEADRDDGKSRIAYDEAEHPRLTWSYDGGYPIFSDSTHLPVYRIDLDDSVFVSYALTDAKGHIVDLPPAYSTEGRYFDSWVDSTGKTVTKTTVFNAHSTIYAKYSKTIKDPSLVVNRPDPTTIGWNGELSVPKWRMHLDTSLYVAIFTPSELAWYLSTGASFTQRAALVNDIVMGKDSLSVMTRELKTISEYGRYIKGYVFNGNGHNIYGLNGALFGTNYGTIRDVHLVNYLVTGHGAFVDTNRGTISKSSLRKGVMDQMDEIRISGFVSLNYGYETGFSIIDSCVNYSNYDLSAGNNPVSVAGIAYENRGTISNSLNLGNIKVQGSGSKITNVAGITLINGTTGNILNSTNEGDIEYDGTISVRLAGIVTDNRADLIKGAKNYGKIYARVGDFSFRVGSSSPAYVAGLAIGANGIDSCANYGDITVVVVANELSGGINFGGILAGDYLRTEINVKNSLNKGAITFVDSSSSKLENIRFGGIAARANILSGKNEGSVKFVQSNPSKKYDSSKDVLVGGLVGEAKTLKDCVNEGYVVGAGSVGGLAGKADSIVKGVNYARIDGLTTGKWSQLGGVCGECGYLENAFNGGSVSLDVAESNSVSYLGGVAGSLGNGRMIANTGSVKAVGNSGEIFVGGLLGMMGSNIVLDDAYNWGEVSSEVAAGGIYGLASKAHSSVAGFDHSYLVTNIAFKNVYNAAPVKAPKANPIAVMDECANATEPEFAVLVYNDSAFTQERGCIEIDEVLGFEADEYYKINFVLTSPLSTKYMQSDEFVELLNTSGKTVENRHVWKKSDTYPVFDEVAFGMSYSVEPSSSSSAVSSSSSATSSSSSSNAILSSSEGSSDSKSSSSIAQSSSSSTIRSSSSSNVIKSSSSTAKSSSSSVKAPSSSSKKADSSSSSVKSSSSSAKTSLPVIAHQRFRMAVQGRTITLHASKGRTVQVFDALGHHVMSKAIPANGETSVTLQESGAYIVRVDGMSQRVVLK